MEESWKGAAIQRGLECRTEEYPLLEAVTRERLVRHNKLEETYLVLW
jgi:hypothetical protein